MVKTVKILTIAVQPILVETFLARVCFSNVSQFYHTGDIMFPALVFVSEMQIMQMMQVVLSLHVFPCGILVQFNENPSIKFADK